jgi:hypothetical protein
MDEQMLAYTNNEVLVDQKKEFSFDICYSRDESWKHCTMWKKPDRKDLILDDSIYMKYPK